MPIESYKENFIPSIIVRRTQEDIEEELQRIENAVPEQLLLEDEISSVQELIIASQKNESR